MSDETSTVVVAFENPSTKEQLIAGTIAVGTALAVPIVVGAGMLLVGHVVELNSDRKKKKAAKKLAESTEETE